MPFIIDNFSSIFTVKKKVLNYLKKIFHFIKKIFENFNIIAKFKLKKIKKKKN